MFSFQNMFWILILHKRHKETFKCLATNYSNKLDFVQFYVNA